MEQPFGPACLNVSLLEQARILLARIDDSAYVRASPLNPEGSVGRHLRHCLDFYRCLLDGLPLGRIDYTHRERAGEIELRREAAGERIRGLVDELQSLEVIAHRPVLVRDEEHRDAAPAGWSRSSLARELQFVASHTLHHLALIGMLLRSLGMEPGPGFGTAPSTLRHRVEGRQAPVTS